MACIKCGGPVKDGESLCEKCSGEDSSFPSAEGTGGKRPKKLNKATIALISVFVILLGIVSVGKLFFNRDFMELIQGKTRYAQNIELATAKSSANQMVTFLDESVKMFQSYIKPKTMESDLQFNIKIEDQLLKDMNLPEEQTASIQQTVKYLNTLKLNTKTLVGKEGAQTTLTLTDPSALKLTVDSLTYNDGKTYLHIPQLLEKYLSVEDPVGSQLSPYGLSKIKYDPAKLQASLEKLAAIYSDFLSEAEIKAENDQSITVDGVTVQGQKLTASLTAAQTSAMVKAIADAAKNDNDLYAFVSDNYGLFSAVSGDPAQPSSEKLTKEEYGKLIDELLSKLNLEKDGATFSAISYLSRNGALLAHSYESSDKTGKGQLNYLITDGKYAVEFLANQKNGFTFTNTRTGEGAGKMQLKIKSEEDPKNIGVTVDYSGCKTVSFLGFDTTVGKYVISLYDPNHEMGKYVQQADLPESFSKLDQMSLTIETAPEGDKLNSTVQLSMPGLLSVSATGKTSGASGEVSIQPQPDPSQVLEPSEDESGEAMNELPLNGIRFLSDTLKNDPELAAVLSGFGISEEQLDMLAAFSQA